VRQNAGHVELRMRCHAPDVAAMMRVEAVLQMLQPGFSVASIAAKRRNKSNPWFKRGTLGRTANPAGSFATAGTILDRRH
jgi:hypothetical protein